jgi:hypothetical protein
MENDLIDKGHAFTMLLILQFPQSRTRYNARVAMVSRKEKGFQEAEEAGCKPVGLTRITQYSQCSRYD